MVIKGKYSMAIFNTLRLMLVAEVLIFVSSLDAAEYALIADNLIYGYSEQLLKKQSYHFQRP
jgi:hypothetical protein